MSLLSNIRGGINFRVLWIFLGPLLFSPLLFFDSKPLKCAYGIILIMSYWLFEVVAIPITALLPILIFPALGIISTHEICSSYLKDTSLLILCTLMIALAVEESNLHNRLALFVLSKFGGYPLAVMIAISSVVTFISIWVTNTSATALTLPITIRILELMIQTRSFSVESNGTHGHGKSKSRNSVKERLKFDLLSCEDRALCKTLVLICAHGALIGGTAMVTGSSTNLIFRELYHTIVDERSSQVTIFNWLRFALPAIIFYSIASLFAILITFYGPRSMLKLFTRASPSDKQQVKIFNARIAKTYSELEPMSWAEKSMLVIALFTVFAWFLRSPGLFPGWSDIFFGNNRHLLTDTNVGIFTVFVLFAWPKERPKFSHMIRPTKDEYAKKSKHYESLLCWSTVQYRFSWSTLLLVGAAFAICESVKKSCLEDVIVEWTRNKLDHSSPISAQLIVVLMGMLVSDFGVATIFLRIALNLAISLNIHPLYLGLPTAICPSLSSMFPMASPSNAIVYDAGVISIPEMALAGIILNVLVYVITIANMNTLAYWVFDFGTIPSDLRHLSLNTTCAY